MAYQKLQVSRALSVTPSNSADIVAPTGGPNDGCVLYVGTAGDIRVTTAGGDDVVFVGIAAGSFIPVQVVKVWATSTTASNIIALW